MTKKKTLGRQRIEVKELEGSKRQVTFSKRRAGLFKKASELCVLCGAEVALMVLTPKQKAYCFGHPDVDTIINRYLSQNNNSFAHSSSQSYVPVDEFNRQYSESEKELEKEKRRMAEIEMKKVGEEKSGGGFWWDEVLDEKMGIEEMNEYMWALKEVRKKVVGRVNEMRNMSGSDDHQSTPPVVVVPTVDLRLGVGNNGFVHPNLQGGNNGGGFFYNHGLGFGPFGHGQL